MKTLNVNINPLLEDNILQYWLTQMVDNEQGGYYGRRNGCNQLLPQEDKGAILNARILWTFSTAFRLLKKEEYLVAATRAKHYIIEHFIDSIYGGVYWSVDYKGNPTDEKKQTYAIAFTIYGMSEYARATGDCEARQIAINLYRDIEQHAYDKVNNGYVEALTRAWTPIADMRLSEKDENGSRTMNTHLHVIEAYTNLLRIWQTEELKERVGNLLTIFQQHIINPATHHLDLFFDEQWQGLRNIESYGHDIEASWLLHEAALVLGNKAILAKITPAIQAIAKASDEGLTTDGAMIYERWKDNNKIDKQRQWWVQCENVIGHFNLFQHWKDEKAYVIAQQCMDYITTHLIDRKNGEWYWSVDENGNPNLKDDKAGFWKCPYHNSRMFFELLERSK